MGMILLLEGNSSTGRFQRQLSFGILLDSWESLNSLGRTNLLLSLLGRSSHISSPRLRICTHPLTRNRRYHQHHNRGRCLFSLPMNGIGTSGNLSFISKSLTSLLATYPHVRILNDSSLIPTHLQGLSLNPQVSITDTASGIYT
jgi:hypothetical protein